MIRLKILSIIWILLFSTFLFSQNDTLSIRVYVFDPFRIIHEPFESLCMFNHIVKISVKVDAVEGLDKALLYYRSKNSDSEYNKLFFTPAPDGENSYEGHTIIPAHEATIGGIEYYIECIDNTGTTNLWYDQDSSYSLPISGYLESLITPAGGSMIFTDGNPDDGKMELSIQKKAFDNNVTVRIKQLEPTKSYSSLKEALCCKPIRMYQIEPDYLRLNKPGTLTLLYSDINNDNKEDSTGINEKKLGIFWWDGFEWRYLGGKVDKKLNTVTAKITHFALYGLFPVGKITADSLRPKERIITPNGDGINDYAHFGGSIGDYTIKILDTAGREIRNIKDTLIWDGKDNNGRYVEGGVYVYQFKGIIEGRPKIISGVIAVAK